MLQFRGVGMEKNYTLGELLTPITIDHATYTINIHVVPDTLTSHSLKLGTDFLDTVELVMKGGEISIAKLNVPEIFNISVETVTERTDLSHITIPEHKKAVKNLVESYKPDKAQNECHFNRRCARIPTTAEIVPRREGRG